MTLDLIFPVLPPALDGIGDYTARLAVELSNTDDVRILTAQADALPVDGGRVQVERAFSLSSRADVRSLISPIRTRRPDWVILQYNPFSYGRWGLNLSLPGVLQTVKETLPDVRVALMVHEPFVDVESWRFAVFTTWQRWQLWRLGRAADAIFFSTEPWVDRFRTWFPSTPLTHLPVGSNIPRVSSDRSAIRSALGLSSDALVCGIFGSAHESRNLSLFRHTMQALAASSDRPLHVLYVGKAGNEVGAGLENVPFIDAGALPAAEVSRHFSAMDLYLAPFRDGVSTRRGSFMVGLQHGVPTVTTIGPDTGPLLRGEAGDAFLAAHCEDFAAYTSSVEQLINDPSARQRYGTAGRLFYEATFDWPQISSRLLETLQFTLSSEPTSAATAP
jgi:glycosyltransferase involved in cell wall biosynthesis